jgi:hypothetical protein
MIATCGCTRGARATSGASTPPPATTESTCPRRDRRFSSGRPRSSSFSQRCPPTACRSAGGPRSRSPHAYTSTAGPTLPSSADPRLPPPSPQRCGVAPAMSPRYCEFPSWDEDKDGVDALFALAREKSKETARAQRRGPRSGCKMTGRG